MPIVNRIAEFEAELIEWRHQLHTFPELGFEEHQTAEFIAGKLNQMGLEVNRGLAGTGVVATLTVGSGNGPKIGLRADMDALPILERSEFEHASKNPGVMHACGHDGHSTMLLGAAKYLAETKNFDGTVQFIFQPAEEGKGGGEKMIADGLFELFPVDEVYGMHNIPGIKVGEFAVCPGPIMAARDNFEVFVKGRGSHAAMPHQGVEPLVVGAFAERNQRAHRLVSELAEAAGPRVQRESAVDAQSAKGLAVWHLKRVLCCSAWSGLAQLQRERAHRFILAGAHVPGTVRPGTTYAGAFQQANSLLAQAAAVNHLTARASFVPRRGGH